MKQHLRPLMFLAVLLFAFFITFAITPGASASGISTANDNSTALARTCGVIEVHSNSMTCLRVRTLAQVYTPESITQGACNTSNTVRVFADNYATVYCFTGYGYTGTWITNVNEADSYGNSLFAWVRVYHNGPGKYCTFDSNNAGRFANGSNSGYLITQVDANSRQGGQCGPF